MIRTIKYFFEKIETIRLLSELEEISEKVSDGYYAIHKLTTSYRVCVRPPSDGAIIADGYEGSTINEAISGCVYMEKIRPTGNISA